MAAEHDADLAKRFESALVASRDLVRKEYEAEQDDATSFAASMRQQLKEAQNHIAEQRDAAEQLLAMQRPNFLQIVQTIKIRTRAGDGSTNGGRIQPVPETGSVGRR